MWTPARFTCKDRNLGYDFGKEDLLMFREFPQRLKPR
jgi:hypothetical protein